MDRIDKKQEKDKGYKNLYHASKDFLDAYYYIKSIDKDNISLLVIIFIAAETILKSYICLKLEIQGNSNFYKESTTNYGHEIIKILKDYKEDILLNKFYKDIEFINFLKVFQDNFISIRYKENGLIYLRRKSMDKMIIFIEEIKKEIEKKSREQKGSYIGDPDSVFKFFPQK